MPQTPNTPGVISTPNPAFSAGQQFGKNVWNNLGNAYSGISNFVGGLFTSNNPPPAGVAGNQNTYTVNGKSFNAAGDPSSTPATSAVNYNANAGTTAGVLQVPQTSSGNAGTGGVNTYGLNSSSPNWYQLQPGESTSNYYARTQGQTQSQALAGSAGTAGSSGVVTPPASTGNNQYSGNPNDAKVGMTQASTGQAAPPGFMWGPDGKLMQSSGMTTNAQGGNVPIPSNVNSGGGTKTNFPSIVGGLASTAAQSSPEYQAALADYNQQKTALQNLQSQFGTQYGNTLNSRTNLAEAQGEQGAISNAEALQSAPLTQRMQADAAILGAATQQQGTQQSGLATAGQLSQPMGANIYGFYNPLTGGTQSYGGGAAGAFNAGEVSGAFGAGQQFQSLIAPSYNQANGILNGNGADPGLNSFLQSHPDINPTSLNAANFWNAWLQGQQFSNPEYQQLGQYLTEFLNTLSPIVGATGDATNYKQQLVNSMINSTASTGSLSTQLQNLWQIAAGKVSSAYGTGQSTANPSNLGNGTGSNTNSQYSW